VSRLACRWFWKVNVTKQHMIHLSWNGHCTDKSWWQVSFQKQSLSPHFITLINNMKIFVEYSTHYQYEVVSTSFNIYTYYMALWLSVKILVTTNKKMSIQRKSKEQPWNPRFTAAQNPVRRYWFNLNVLVIQQAQQAKCRELRKFDVHSDINHCLWLIFEHKQIRTNTNKYKRKILSICMKTISVHLLKI